MFCANSACLWSLTTGELKRYTVGFSLEHAKLSKELEQALDLGDFRQLWEVSNCVAMLSNRFADNGKFDASSKLA